MNMNIRYIIISALLFCCFRVFGQNGQALFEKGMQHYQQNECFSAFTSFQQAVNRYNSEKAGKLVIAKAHYMMGTTLQNLTNCSGVSYSPVTYLNLAANAGYAPAYTALGVICATGLPKGKVEPKNENKALAYFQKAAAMGDAEGQYHLANFYLNGTATGKDEAEAIRLLVQATLGDYRQAVTVLKGLDRQKVKDEFQKSAKKKMTDVEQYNAANYFHASEDYHEAFVWFQKCAERKNVKAQGKMGLYYESGSFGIPKDMQKAYAWYLKAAESGQEYYQFKLGEFHEKGTVGNVDMQKAFEWYEKAANNGYSSAQDWIADYYYGKENYPAAAEWYLKAAENGSFSSQNRLGVMYLEGKGVSKDLKKALEWFLKSAQGNHWGQYNAGMCYEYGFGVAKNSATAKEWYLKALAGGNPNARKALEQLTTSEPPATSGTVQQPAVSTGPVITPFEKPMLTARTKTVTIAKPEMGRSGMGRFSCGLLPVFNPIQPGGGAWGFLDTGGNLVIDFKFKSLNNRIPQFSENVCAAPLWTKDHMDFDKEGCILIDTKGQTIAKLEDCFAVSAFSSGVASAVSQKSHYAARYAIFINRKGEHIFQHLTFEIPQFEHKAADRVFSDGLMAYYDYQKSIWGFIDASGKIVIPAQYRAASDFHEGLAAVQIVESPGYWGYIDKTGNMAIPPNFSNKPYSFSNGYAVAVKRDKSVCYIDKTGNVALDGLALAGTFHKGFAFIAVKRASHESTKYYLIDQNFNKIKTGPYHPTLIGQIYAESTGWDEYEVVDDLCHVKGFGDYSKFIDHKGNVISDGIYHTNFYDGLAYATLYMGPDGYRKKISGFINKKGEFVFIFKNSEF